MYSFCSTAAVHKDIEGVAARLGKQQEKLDQPNQVVSLSSLGLINERKKNFKDESYL